MSNLVNINNFVNRSSSSILVLNNIDDSVCFFYQFILKYYAKKNNKIIENISNETNIADDLFQIKKIYIAITKSIKEINKIIDKKLNCFLITDYKNYKNLQKNFDFINGYKVLDDIKIFIIQELNIKKNLLINNISTNPYSIYSEIEKYLVNPDMYNENCNINTDNDSMLNIRKLIYNEKNNSNILKVYKAIKEEAKIKKFSFLTY